MKNVFYFMFKVIFVLEIFTLLSQLFPYVEKRLDKKAKVTVMASHIGKQIMTLNTLFNIWGIKDNQAMRFC